MMPITDHQRRRIFGLCNELGWSDEMRRDMVREWVGKPSLSAKAADPVTEGEARRILAYLTSSVARSRRERRGKGLRQRRTWNKLRLTPEQLHRIVALRRSVFGNDVSSFRGWLSKRYDVEEAERLTVAQASACIVGLERMKASGWKPRREAVA